MEDIEELRQQKLDEAIQLIDDNMQLKQVIDLGLFRDEI